MDPNRRSLRWLLAIPTLFLAYFFVYPLVSILWVSLTAGDGRPWADVLESARIGRVVWFSLWQASASTVLTVALGLPVAWAFSRFEFPARRLLRAALTIPFVLPTVVVASAFLVLFGRGSAVPLVETVWIILLAHIFYNLAVVVRVVGGLWESIDDRLVEAALTMGANRWAAFRAVTLPLLRPAIAAASAIVFLFSFTSFGVVLLLGGLRYSTIEVAVWRRYFLLDLQGAATLAIVQLIGVTVVLTVYARWQRRRQTQQAIRSGRLPSPTGWKQRSVVFGIVGTALIVELGPLVTLIIRSFRTTGGYGLANYTALTNPDSAFLVTPATAIGNSLRFGLAAMVLAVVIGGIAALVIASRQTSTWFDTLLMLPLGTSAVTIGFGFVVALGRPIDLRTSMMLVPIAHALVAIPFVVRTTVPVLASIRNHLREAAATLGASPRQVLRKIDLPIASKALAAGGGLAFAVSLGEFGATSFIARPNAPTLPVAIFRFLSRPAEASFGKAMAMSTILMIVTAVVIVAIDGYRTGDL